jgi:hypothetical protein
MRLNLGRVKPAGVAAGVLWDFAVGVLPRSRSCWCGVSGRPLERVAVVGESPVHENSTRGLGVAPE